MRHLAIAILFGSALAAVAGAQAQAPLSLPVDGAPSAEALGWRLGCQAYSFNRFTFFEAVDKVASMGLHYIEAYGGQRFSPEKSEVRFDHNMSEELQAEALAKLQAAGVKLVNYGVVPLSADEAESRKVFEFAKRMGIETICSEPAPEAFDTIEKLCDEYGVNVALHNHPEPSRYWNPDTVLAATEGRGARIGACADTGHWMRSGVNPVEGLQKLEGRIITFHFKDLNGYGKEGVHDMPWGTGQGNLRAMLEEIHRQGLKAVFSVEYEHNWDDSVPEIAQSVLNFEAVAKDILAREQEAPKQ